MLLGLFVYCRRALRPGGRQSIPSIRLATVFILFLFLIVSFVSGTRPCERVRRLPIIHGRALRSFAISHETYLHCIGFRGRPNCLGLNETNRGNENVSLNEYTGIPSADCPPRLLARFFFSEGSITVNL